MGKAKLDEKRYEGGTSTRPTSHTVMSLYVSGVDLIKKKNAWTSDAKTCLTGLKISEGYSLIAFEMKFKN